MTTELAFGEGTLPANLIRFADGLRAREIEVTTSQLLTAVNAVDQINPARRADFREALAACLLTTIDNRAAFDIWFYEFWSLPDPRPRPRPRISPGRGGRASPGRSWFTEERPLQGPALGSRSDRREGQPGSYSPDHLLMTKDFATYSDEDVHRSRLIIRAIAPHLAAARSRRREFSASGSEPDLRRSLREAARRGGEVTRLLKRRRKTQRLRLALLADVSGSMDVYSRFLVQFIYALEAELPQVSTFVFSTMLFDVTRMIRGRDFDSALAQVAKTVTAWSGGTDIGASLRTFNAEYARRWATSRLVVAIISDGWDRGDSDVLAREMAHLKRRSYRLIWLNPLLGSPSYKPLATGIAAALPFVDHFLPVHNLASLAKVARLLAT